MGTGGTSGKIVRSKETNKPRKLVDSTDENEKRTNREGYKMFKKEQS